MSAGIVDAFAMVMGARDNSAPDVQPVTEPHGFASDIPLNLAIAAHAGSSFVPDQRGHQVRADYAETLSKLYAELLKHAPTPDKVIILNEQFARFREGCAKRYRAYLTSQSRVMSTMIAGPSNFPFRRMEKRNRVADKRREDLVDFIPRAKDAILKALHPEWRPIMAGDDNAADRLAEKIAKAEDLQARMKAANLAIRKYRKTGNEAQIRALVDLGFTEGRAKLLLEPDFCGRIGFADFELTNNNANIRRMKERLESVAANQAKESTRKEGEHADLEDCPADNRIRLFFAGKPDEAIRTDLKRSGFRWSPTIGAWQAYRNWRTIEKAHEIAGVVL